MLAATISAACYQPAARDCVVSCVSTDDCLDGQACGSDGWCAAPPRAGRCQTLIGDAGVADDPDAEGTVADARESIDASVPLVDAAMPTVTLRVVVSGRGRVLIDPGDWTCEGSQNQAGDCSFDVVAGAQLTLVPAATHQHWDFAGWTTGNCAGQSGACTLDLDAATLVAARFSDGGNDDDDD